MTIMNNQSEKLKALLKLSHDLANPLNPLPILGEGNTSARLSDKTFLVKASGSCLGSLRKEDVVECRAGLLLQMLDETDLSDSEVDEDKPAATRERSIGMVEEGAGDQAARW